MANKKEKIFYAVGAIVAEVKSNTKYMLLALVNRNDVADFTKPELRFEVDFSKSPKKCGHAKFDDVLGDNIGCLKDGTTIPPNPLAFRDFPLAITSIGSDELEDPALGGFTGGVYLDTKEHKKLKNKHFKDWPGDKYNGVELTSIVRIDEADNRQRYHGFMAKVVEVNASEFKVEFLREVDPTTNKPLTATFKKGDESTHYSDPPSDALHGETSIAKDPKVTNPPGALFVELSKAVGSAMRGPKIPVGLFE